MSERAVSVTVNYVLTLAITTVLIAGLITGAASLIDGTEKQTTKDGYEVAGNRVAAGIQAADRLAQSGSVEVTMTVDLPDRIAGTQYRISVNNNSSPPEVTISGVSRDQSVSVPVTNQTELVGGEVFGGDIRVHLRKDEKLEVLPA